MPFRSSPALFLGVRHVCRCGYYPIGYMPSIRCLKSSLSMDFRWGVTQIVYQEDDAYFHICDVLRSCNSPVHSLRELSCHGRLADVQFLVLIASSPMQAPFLVPITSSRQLDTACFFSCIVAVCEQTLVVV